MLHGHRVKLGEKMVQGASRAWDHYKASIPNPVEPLGPIARAGRSTPVIAAKRAWLANLPNRLPPPGFLPPDNYDRPIFDLDIDLTPEPLISVDLH
eukprot:5444916-Prymnesium_polylepis.1